MENKKQGSPIVGILFWVFFFFVISASFRACQMLGSTELNYTKLATEIEAGNIKTLNIGDAGEVFGEFTKPEMGEFRSHVNPEMVADLGAKIEKSPNKITVKHFPEGMGWFEIALSILPILFLVFMFMLLFRGPAGGGGINPLSMIKSRARLVTPYMAKATFKDVAGIDEVRDELNELIEFLKDPGKFSKLGGRVPKGFLLIGPPGSGKTLLARAVAGEAKIPFYYTSGSEFVEMFVGVGAGRARDLFESAKKNPPCIIFIDELDAIGHKRDYGFGGGHSERDQTLNQLLVEMDGFEPNSGIIVIGATNRPEILDAALMRPGRFDRKIIVSNPDVGGRLAILRVHSRKIRIANLDDLEVIARGTPGFSGADLANLLNEAALIATRADKDAVGLEHLELAKDKIMMGLERKSTVLNEKEKEITAYHEAGHTLAAFNLPDADPLHKVTIIPRGTSLGSTWQLPKEDKHSYSKKFLLTQLVILTAGRVAERTKFGEDYVTTGASNDIEVATTLAKRMVCDWGMSQIGLIKIDDNRSERMLEEADERIKKFITDAEKEAARILDENRDKFEVLARKLIEKETLDSEDIRKVLE